MAASMPARTAAPLPPCGTRRTWSRTPSMGPLPRVAPRRCRRCRPCCRRRPRGPRSPPGAPPRRARRRARVITPAQVPEQLVERRADPFRLVIGGEHQGEGHLGGRHGPRGRRDRTIHPWRKTTARSRLVPDAAPHFDWDHEGDSREAPGRATVTAMERIRSSAGRRASCPSQPARAAGCPRPRSGSCALRCISSSRTSIRGPSSVSTRGRTGGWTSPTRTRRSGVGEFSTYLYSPAFAQFLSPLYVLPFEAFFVLWTAASVAVLYWLVRPWPWALLILLLPWTYELFVGQVHLFIAAAIVLGFRWPALWAFNILTKVTPGVGLLWFLVRREWRPLAIALGTTARDRGCLVPPRADRLVRLVQLPSRQHRQWRVAVPAHRRGGAHRGGWRPDRTVAGRSRSPSGWPCPWCGSSHG